MDRARISFLLSRISLHSGCQEKDLKKLEENLVLYNELSYYHCDKSYKYYGEYALNKDIEETIIDRSGLNIEAQVILNQFLDRMESVDYIHSDSAFVDKYVESKGKLNSEETDSEKWDHYNLLRFIWICFTKYQRLRDDGSEDNSDKSKTIRQLGMSDIWKGTPYNTTKTYFWAQLVFFGLRVDSSYTKLSTTSFNYFLVQNPSLSNSYERLINHYYSQKLCTQMDSEEKRNEMILPDIMALPSLITDVKGMKAKQERDESGIEFKKAMLSDAVFIKQFEERTFKAWDNHTSFLRVIWCYLNNSGMSEQNIATKWKLYSKENYHETKTFFWIRIVKYYRKKYKEFMDNKDKMEMEESKQGNEDGQEEERQTVMGTWSFDGFVYFCQSKEVQIENEDLCYVYYSQDVIDTDKAKQTMVNPNKAEFPQ